MAKFRVWSQEVWNRLLGDLGETFFKNYSNYRGFAYSRAEDIGWEFIHRRLIRFKKGFQRIDVRIPDELGKLLVEIIEPNPDYPKTPAYSFDFITCVIEKAELEDTASQYVVEGKEVRSFTIVEVKTGNSYLTKNEERVRELCRKHGVRYGLYRIVGIHRPLREWDLRVEV